MIVLKRQHHVQQTLALFFRDSFALQCSADTIKNPMELAVRVAELLGCLDLRLENAGRLVLLPSPHGKPKAVEVDEALFSQRYIWLPNSVVEPTTCHLVAISKDGDFGNVKVVRGAHRAAGKVGVFLSGLKCTWEVEKILRANHHQGVEGGGIFAVVVDDSIELLLCFPIPTERVIRFRQKEDCALVALVTRAWRSQRPLDKGS